MIFARLKFSEDTDIKLINSFIDVVELEEEINISIDWSPDKLDIKIIIFTDVEGLLEIEDILVQMFLNKGTLQMEVSTDSEDKIIEEQLNYRFFMVPSLIKPQKQFMLKLFPAKDLLK